MMSDKATPILDELSKAGHSLLDTVEKAIFGRVGGADAAVSGLDADPLEKLRAEVALEDERRVGDRQRMVEERAAREARALAELDALKSARAAPELAPKKRTL